MAHLSDMEELVASVQDAIIRDYMSESLSCYMTGAYRASVVLTFIALFDDIVSKLGELGKVNKKARAIFDAATQKRADQEVFESYLIDQLKANSLLTSLDAGFLETLRTLRNKAAHPSGHHASAEEARFVFFEAVSRFLSKPILSTTQLADGVLATLSDSNLFPSVKISVAAKVVKKELQNIHPQTFPYLITNILDKVKGADKVASLNARYFLNGMAHIGSEDVISALKKYVIEKNASNKDYTFVIVCLISANGKLFQELDEVTYQRIAVLVQELIEGIDEALMHTKLSHPVALFASLFKNNSADDVLSKLGAQYDAFIDRFPYSAPFLSDVLPYPVPREILISKLCSKASSSDFYTANDFVRHAGDIEKIMSEHLTAREAFRLLVSVIRAADVGAFSSIDMRNAHFSAVPTLRHKALGFFADEPSAANEIASEILGEDELDGFSGWLAEPA